MTILLLRKRKLRHSLGRPSRSDFVQPEFDAAIDKSKKATDDEGRLEAYKEAEQILIDDSAFIPVYYTTKEYFLKPWVKDFRWSSYGASMEFYITYIEGRNK